MNLLNTTDADEIVERAASLKRKYSGVAGPFLPMVANEYCNAKHRICFIGKATAGDFGSRVLSRAAVERSLNEIMTNPERLPNSPFWSFIGSVTGELLEKEPVGNVAGWPLRYVLWNNLLKIGSTAGNPSGAFAREQRDDAVRWLQNDLKAAKPDVLVLLTNNFEIDVWCRALKLSSEPVGWTQRNIGGDAGAVWSRSKKGMHVFWCRHPQGESREWRTGVLRHIVKVVKG